MAKQHPFKQLYLNPKFSDFTIICPKSSSSDDIAENIRIPAHRAILCPQSDYFSALCNSDFKEAEAREIELEEEEDITKKLLEWFYTGDYSTSDGSVETTAEAQETDAHQKTKGKRRLSANESAGLPPFGPADLGDVGLARNTKRPCPSHSQAGNHTDGENLLLGRHSVNINRQSYESRYAFPIIQESMSPDEEENALTELKLHTLIYAAADKYNLDELQNLSSRKFQAKLRLPIRSLKPLLRIVPLIYSTLPCVQSTNTIRSNIVKHVLDHISVLRSPEYMDEFERVQDEFPQFGRDILKQLLSFMDEQKARKDREREKTDWRHRRSAWEIENHIRRRDSQWCTTINLAS